MSRSQKLRKCKSANCIFRCVDYLGCFTGSKQSLFHHVYTWQESAWHSTSFHSDPWHYPRLKQTMKLVSCNINERQRTYPSIPVLFPQQCLRLTSGVTWLNLMKRNKRHNKGRSLRSVDITRITMEPATGETWIAYETYRLACQTVQGR